MKIRLIDLNLNFIITQNKRFVPYDRLVPGWKPLKEFILVIKFHKRGLSHVHILSVLSRESLISAQEIDFLTRMIIQETIEELLPSCSINHVVALIQKHHVAKKKKYMITDFQKSIYIFHPFPRRIDFLLIEEEYRQRAEG